jgi:hypothetical protein
VGEQAGGWVRGRRAAQGGAMRAPGCWAVAGVGVRTCSRRGGAAAGRGSRGAAEGQHRGGRGRRRRAHLHLAPAGRCLGHGQLGPLRVLRQRDVGHVAAAVALARLQRWWQRWAGRGAMNAAAGAGPAGHAGRRRRARRRRGGHREEGLRRGAGLGQRAQQAGLRLPGGRCGRRAAVGLAARPVAAQQIHPRGSRRGLAGDRGRCVCSRAQLPQAACREGTRVRAASGLGEMGLESAKPACAVSAVRCRRAGAGRQHGARARAPDSTRRRSRSRSRSAQQGAVPDDGREASERARRLRAPVTPVVAPVATQTPTPPLAGARIMQALQRRPARPAPRSAGSNIRGAPRHSRRCVKTASLSRDGDALFSLPLFPLR